METVTFNSVRLKANTLFSGKPTPTSDDSASLAVFINARYREFLESYFWPEWMAIEKRQFRPNYATSSTYVATNEVYYPATQLYYQALRAVPINQPPDLGTGSPLNPNNAYWAASLSSYSGNNWSTATYVAGDAVYQPLDGNYYQTFIGHSNQSPPNASYWGLLTGFVRSLDLTAGNQGATATSLGGVKAIWDSDPQVNETARPQWFDRYASKLVVRGLATVVWVEFRLLANDFTGSNWSSSASYALNDQVYYATTGEYYICIQANSGQLPTATAYWTKLNFLKVLKEATAQAAYGDMLKLAGKGNKFDSEYGEALRLLRREWTKLERLEHHTDPLNVLSR